MQLCRYTVEKWRNKSYKYEGFSNVNTKKRREIKKWKYYKSDNI